MRVEYDTVQFESRREVDAVLNALEEWQEEHEESPAVQELIGKLEEMSMCW